MLRYQKELDRVFQIFEASEAEIRPHFILTGESGSGKSYNIKKLADKYKLGYCEINAAALTKEGTSGNSLSKALAPLGQMTQKPSICFVDEFDKLFISGNHNSDLAHETTNGVQNEFLKVLESDTASVFGDYGKYVNIPMKHVLFVFAGAFNGEADIDIDRLRELGIKTEFLGRVGLTFSTEKVTLDMLLKTMRECQVLRDYLKLFPKTNRKEVEEVVGEQIKDAYEKNTLGYRIITTLIHQFFITGGKANSESNKRVVFNKTMEI